MTTLRPWLIAGAAALLVVSLSACAASGAPSPTRVAATQSGGPAPAATTGGGGAAPTQDWRNAPLSPEEVYNDSPETPFKDVATNPLSTFSSDVDTASYANLRRQITNHQMPEGVRIEELVNYFDYDYAAPGPEASDPFAVSVEVADCPWAPDHKLAMIGVQATRAVPTSAGNNLVLLLDVSGSMSAPNKLPLLVDSFSLLVDTLGPDDVVSIVTYAGSDRIAADSVSGADHRQLKRILEGLTAGGSTGGANGLMTAYDLARKNFIEGGNNRVILATDGDFNVGPSSDAAMTDLIERERVSGVYVSVLGFGMGNLKDSKLESIADHGNGNYAYIDTLNEANKVLVNEFDSTMFVVAQDLKLQVEFNGAVVQQYRLIGYDNRRLENEDFANDTKDAGDVGAGHSVTAFYELILAGEDTVGGGLRYSNPSYGDSTDYMTVALRYKAPGGTESKLVEVPVGAEAYTTTPSVNFRFASAVTEFGLIVTDSAYQGTATLANVTSRASRALGEDPYGLRAEFLSLVQAYGRLG